MRTYHDEKLRYPTGKQITIQLRTQADSYLVFGPTHADWVMLLCGAGWSPANGA